MQRSKSIAARFREVLLSGYWVANTNYKELLASVSWKEAIERVGDLNTIAELTYHVNYYLSGLLVVFEGGALEIRDKYSFDMPVIKAEDEWKELVSTFITNSERFAENVEQIPDKQLNEVFINEKYGTYLRNLEGVIEHSYYHLGQISLLKKMIRGNAKWLTIHNE